MGEKNNNVAVSRKDALAYVSLVRDMSKNKDKMKRHAENVFRRIGNKITETNGISLLSDEEAVNFYIDSINAEAELHSWSKIVFFYLAVTHDMNGCDLLDGSSRDEVLNLFIGNVSKVNGYLDCLPEILGILPKNFIDNNIRLSDLISFMPDCLSKIILDTDFHFRLIDVLYDLGFKDKGWGNNENLYTELINFGGTIPASMKFNKDNIREIASFYLSEELTKNQKTNQEMEQILNEVNSVDNSEEDKIDNNLSLINFSGLKNFFCWLAQKIRCLLTRNKQNQKLVNNCRSNYFALTKKTIGKKRQIPTLYSSCRSEVFHSFND